MRVGVRKGVSVRTLIASLVLFPIVLGKPCFSATELDPVVVTATRIPEPLFESLSSTFVIDRDTVERHQSPDIADLLRFHAGLDVTRSGGPGQQTSLFLRGADSNQTLFLLDGVPINPGTLGTAPLQNISADLVERIEVSKGPRSVLYGSDAIGGVVQIFTRRSKTGAPPRFSGSVSAGPDSTRQLTAFLSGSYGRGYGSLAATHYSTDGYPPLRNSKIAAGHRADNLDARFGMPVGSAELRLSHLESRGDTDYLDFFGDLKRQDFHHAVSAATISGSPAESWSSTLLLSRFVDSLDQRESADFARTDRLRVDWQNDFRPTNGHRVTAGLIGTDTRTRSEVFGIGYDERAYNLDLFLQDDIELGKHRIVAGLGYVENEQFGGHANWSLAYGYHLAPDTRLFASAASAFRAPDSTDLYGFGGNPELDPERSIGAEIGIRHRLGHRAILTVSLFGSRIDDLIIFSDPDDFLGPIPGKNYNIDEARITGIDLALDFSQGLWYGRAEAVFQDPVDTKSHETLPRRSKKSFAASLGYGNDRFDMGIELLASGPRIDSSFNPVRLPGYTLADMSGRYFFNRRWNVQLRIENIFDTDYEPAAGYQGARRAFLVGVRYDTTR